MIGLWILVYTITATSGPALNTQSVPLKYPLTEIAFEPPSDWQGCAKQKEIMVPLRKLQLEAMRYKGVKVTARCREMGKNG